MKKKLTFLIIFLITANLAKATINDSTRNEISGMNEIGRFSNYFMKYSHKISGNIWLKSGISYTGDYIKDEPVLNNNFTNTQLRNNLGFILGIDKHLNTAIDKVDFVYGSHLRLNLYNYISTTDNPSISEKLQTTYRNYYGLGIGFTFALYYNLNKYFAIGSEINPYYLYQFEKEEFEDNNKETRMDFVLTNISIIALRFKW